MNCFKLTNAAYFWLQITSPAVGSHRYLADGKESNNEGEKKKGKKCVTIPLSRRDSEVFLTLYQSHSQSSSPFYKLRINQPHKRKYHEEDTHTHLHLQWARD